MWLKGSFGVRPVTLRDSWDLRSGYSAKPKPDCDGIELHYFQATDSEEAFRFARRASVAITRLKQSRDRYLSSQRATRRPRRT